MNEEEKAIEWIRRQKGKYYKACINYIDKLQKENKELKEENKELRDTNKKLYEMGKQRAIQELLNKEQIYMNKEEREIIYTLEGSIDTYIEGTKVIKVQLTTKQAEILLNLISKLQKGLDKKDKVIENAFRYVKKKQSQQYKYALSKIECDELIKILKAEEENE